MQNLAELETSSLQEQRSQLDLGCEQRDENSLRPILVGCVGPGWAADGRDCERTCTFVRPDRAIRRRSRVVEVASVRIGKSFYALMPMRGSRHTKCVSAQTMLTHRTTMQSTQKLGRATRLPIVARD